MIWFCVKLEKLYNIIACFIIYKLHVSFEIKQQQYLVFVCAHLRCIDALVQLNLLGTKESWFIRVYVGMCVCVWIINVNIYVDMIALNALYLCTYGMCLYSADDGLAGSDA